MFEKTLNKIAYDTKGNKTGKDYIKFSDSMPNVVFKNLFFSNCIDTRLVHSLTISHWFYVPLLYYKTIKYKTL